MKTWFLSDTHRLHDQLIIPEVDCLVFAGDSTNYKDLYQNELEFYSFKNWLFNLNIPKKILIFGNHDTHGLKIYNVDDLKYNGVVVLDHEYYDLNGKLIFGSPYTPTYGNWNFMVNRNKLSRYWEVLTDNIDILITHGPPKGILDLSYNKDYELEYCGDGALFKALMKLKQPPKLHVFGHIHNSHDCYNQGIREFNNIKFMNVSVVNDGKMDKITSNGIIIDI